MSEFIDLLVYSNDIGTHVEDVSGNDPEIDYEEWLVNRVEELDDDPFMIICLHVWNYEGTWHAEQVWHPVHRQDVGP